MFNDKFYMLRALKLAQKAEGKTSPNPIVGCVIVKNNRVISEGYHRGAGLHHAEITALKKARNTKNATMYVTLEPCDHYGKTPPCTDEIIKRKIRKVVIAIKDPNEINNGRGVRKLRRNKISVKLGVLEKEANKIYRPYAKFITEKLPFVTVKIAESLDGKIATSKGESKWISNELSRIYVHKLRSRVDAVMVGINTVLKDNPLLLARIRPKEATKRVVVDSKLKLPLNSQLIRTARIAPLIIATTNKSSKKKRNMLTKKGALVIVIRSKNSKIDLQNLFQALATMDIMHVLVEGGGELIGSLFDEGLVDRMLFFISPKIIGGETAVTSIRGRGVQRINDAIRLKNMEIKRFKEDILVEGNVYRHN